MTVSCPNHHDRKVAAPYALLMELTYDCPLKCTYCSNPVDLISRSSQLKTSNWLDVLDQAAALGVVQVGLSGGEPLTYPGLHALIEHASRLGMYTNLISSGIGLREDRVRTLASSGLDNFQLSIQAASEESSALIAGVETLAEKRQAAKLIAASPITLTMNVVLHKHNIDDLEEIIDLTRSWQAKRLELANVQYHGWALKNRHFLLPDREAVDCAEKVYFRKKAELKGIMEILWVVPDYFEGTPKPCMGGWGSTHLTVTPDGTVTPCPQASTISSLKFESVKEKRLDWIWYHSASFNKFRGFDWMPDPCRSCDKRFADFGGCRCQAFALAGDAGTTDPACSLSEHHYLIETHLKQKHLSEEPDPPAYRKR